MLVTLCSRFLLAGSPEKMENKSHKGKEDFGSSDIENGDGIVKIS